MNMAQERKPVPEEERILAGKLFCPGNPDLVAIKTRSHALCREYNATDETDKAARKALIEQILGDSPEGCSMTGPIFFHYGVHTHIGKEFFSNYNLTIQDDGLVTIGDRVNFGPNVTIATAIHPMLGAERYKMLDPSGKPGRAVYARPVTIGNDVWLGANVTICGGANIGSNCVIGAGSVVTRDIRIIALRRGCRAVLSAC